MKIDQEIKQKMFKNEWQKALVNVIFTSSWLNLKIKEHLKEYGITPQQFNALKILNGQYPNPVSTSVVRERMLDKMSDVSRIVARLQEKKLVNVCKANRDKRLVDIVISEKGVELIAKIDIENAHMDAIITGLSEEEAGLLSNLLDKMRG